MCIREENLITLFGFWNSSAVCYLFFVAIHLIVISSTPRHVKESKSKYKHSVVKHYKPNLYLQLFVGGIMSYLSYLCLFAYSGV